MVKFKALNLGCGKDYKESNDEWEYVNADIDKDLKVDKIVDFNKKFPFDDDIFDIVFASNSIEHCENIGFTIMEIMRVLKKKGTLIMIVPVNQLGVFHCEHNYFFHFAKLFGRQRRMPHFLQRLLGYFYSNEMEVAIVKR